MEGCLIEGIKWNKLQYSLMEEQTNEIIYRIGISIIGNSKFQQPNIGNFHLEQPINAKTKHKRVTSSTRVNEIKACLTVRFSTNPCLYSITVDLIKRKGQEIDSIYNKINPVKTSCQPENSDWSLASGSSLWSFVPCCAGMTS